MQLGERSFSLQRLDAALKLSRYLPRRLQTNVQTSQPLPCASGPRSSKPRRWELLPGGRGNLRIPQPPGVLVVDLARARGWDGNVRAGTLLDFGVLDTDAVQAAFATPRAPKAAPLAVGSTSELKSKSSATYERAHSTRSLCIQEAILG